MLKRLAAAFFELLFIVIIISIVWFAVNKVKHRAALVSVGKPGVIQSSTHAKVEKVFIKPGDTIIPSQEIISYIITSPESKAPKTEAARVPVDVTVQQIQGITFEDVVELPGMIYPMSEIDVSAQVGGKIISIPCDEGQRVKQGDLLMKIEDTDYRAALKQAEASFELASLQYRRLKNLKAKNAVSASSYDDAAAAFKMAEAAYDTAKINLDRCTVTAPDDGRIDLRSFDIGEVVNPGDKLVRLINVCSLKIVIGIPEKDVSLVRDKKFIDFEVSALGKKKYRGMVHHISYSQTDSARVFPMEIRIENKDSHLLPGMVVKARVIRSTFENAVILPLFMVIPGDDEYYTYVFEKSENNQADSAGILGHAVKKVLKIGSFTGQSVHITQGLTPGDHVISRGLRLLSSGEMVRSVNESR
jgi:RND family efflux transporter MFP subunit